MTTKKRKIERRRCSHCGAPLLLRIFYSGRSLRDIPVDAPRFHCGNCGRACVKPMRTRAQQGTLEFMLMLQRMRRAKLPPFRVEERGVMGCLLIRDWEPLGEFRTFCEAIAAVREIKKGSTRELRIIGPSGVIRYQRGQRPVTPFPSSSAA